MQKKVAVIGMGYVGLPLALRAVSVGFSVVGVDVSSERVDFLNSGKSFTEEIPDLVVREALQEGLVFTCSFGQVSECDVIVICVPTPLDIEEKAPDISPVLAAVAEVAPRVSVGSLIVVESTVSPGTTEGPILEALVSGGLELDTGFFLGFSPERINPGSTSRSIESVPKLVSGCSPASLEQTQLFYEALVDVVVPVSGTREAEFAKLLENSYRLVNIGLVNELAFSAAKMGIDFGEVVRAASTKPYGFEAFLPSAGAGGHCIPVDPVYLLNEIQGATGDDVNILAAAITSNKAAPARFVDEVLGAGRDLTGTAVLVCGLGYKPGVTDTRHSPAIGVIRRLIQLGAKVDVYDKEVARIQVDGSELHSVTLEDSPHTFHLAVLLHQYSAGMISAIRSTSRELVGAVGSFGVV